MKSNGFFGMQLVTVVGGMGGGWIVNTVFTEGPSFLLCFWKRVDSIDILNVAFGGIWIGGVDSFVMGFKVSEKGVHRDDDLVLFSFLPKIVTDSLHGVKGRG